MATTRKNTLNSTANEPTTNVPSNTDRSVPINVSVATSAAITPTSDSGIATHFRSRETNRSTTITVRIVPDRISSGASAWKSTDGCI